MAYKFKERVFYFLDNGYWHGIRFLGSRCKFFGRFFWLIVMIASGIGMTTIFKSTLQNFQEDVININVDTSFLHWRNTFPAVSMCFTKGGSVATLLNFMRAFWQANNLTSPTNELGFALWMRTYLFVSPNENLDENEFCVSQNSTCGFDVDTLMKALVPQTCSDFMSEVKFLDRPHDCEDIFKPIKTEMGQCFTANSLYFQYSKYGNQLPLQYGQSDRTRTLSFKYNGTEDIYKFMLYVHSPEEHPYFDMEPIFLSNVAVQYALFETIETINSNEVRLESIDQRKCRFPDERLENSVLPYSFSSCFTDKRIAIELKLCNCTLHTSPTEYKDQYCDYKGLLCISEASIPEVIKEDYRSGKMCVESCIEMQINVLGDWYEDVIDNTTETEHAEELVVIEISNQPTVRYARNVAKTRLDFVVSIGGLVGLFFGASLLSLVEIVYIWLIRRF